MTVSEQALLSHERCGDSSGQFPRRIETPEISSRRGSPRRSSELDAPECACQRRGRKGCGGTGGDGASLSVRVVVSSLAPAFGSGRASAVELGRAARLGLFCAQPLTLQTCSWKVGHAKRPVRLNLQPVQLMGRPSLHRVPAAAQTALATGVA